MPVALSAPGIKQAYVGQDYRGTKGLLLDPSGSDPNKPTVYSEVAAIENNLQTQVDLLKQNVKSNISVAIRWSGTKQSLIDAIALAAFDAVNNTLNLQGVDIKVDTTGMAPGDLRDASFEFGILLDEGLPLSTPVLNTGFYYLTKTGANPVALTHASFANVELVESLGENGIGTVILIDKGTSENSFYTIAHSVTELQVIGSDNVPKLVVTPWGRLQDLDTDPTSFLTIAGTTLGANLNTAQFTVVGGVLNLNTTLTDQITLNTNNIAANAAAISANTASIGTNAAAIATNTSNISTNAADISTNTADIAQNATDISDLLNNVIPTLATQTGVSATMAEWHQETHQIIALAGGTFDAVEQTTTFVVTPSSVGVNNASSLDWAVVRISEVAAPWTEIAPPKIEYDDTTYAAPSIILTFYAATQVPNGQIEVFLNRFFRSFETPEPEYLDVAAGS